MSFDLEEAAGTRSELRVVRSGCLDVDEPHVELHEQMVRERGWRLGGNVPRPRHLVGRRELVEPIDERGRRRAKAFRTTSKAVTSVYAGRTQSRTGP